MLKLFKMNMVSIGGGGGGGGGKEGINMHVSAHQFQSVSLESREM